ncbi:MAG: hypothetical protein H6510_14010 [Acidobacteria bacterium]|nr:hypothetical protein [Acidobacteriota bacterium]MCB9398923.1 hypothetical protein [Acidobacteriota bacterium]
MRSLFLLCLCGLTVLAQNYIKEISDANPFDPNRGQEPPEEIVEAPVITADLPILDGTIIFADQRFAMLSYNQDGEPKTARVTVKDSFAGYEVAAIDFESVTLSNGGDTTALKLYSGVKKNRGGSRVAPAPMAKKEAAPALVSPGGDGQVVPANPTAGGPKPTTSRFQKASPAVPPSSTVQQSNTTKRENAKGKM